MRGNVWPVGRESELEALWALLGRPDDLPSVAVVVGEAGIGKTTVVDAVVAAAETDGFRILRCRPAETEAALAFVALGDLLHDAGAAIATLPGPQRRALERALLLIDAEGSAPVDERAVALGFLGCLRALTADGPLLVVADDVQWLDEPSLAALRFALSRLAGLPVAAVLAARGSRPRWLPVEPGAVVELDGLSVGALHEALRHRLSRPLSRPALLRIHAVSGGNPFYALELARALERRGGVLEPDGGLPLPDSLDELVAERLSDLPAEAVGVARAAAALGEPEAGLLGAVVELDPGLDAAVAAGVLVVDRDRVRFSHPLLASGLLARIPPGDRRELHARCAAVVGDPERRARHLALAATDRDREVAAALDDGARHARMRGAPSVAAELATLALELSPAGDDAALRRRAVAAASLLFEAGALGQAVAVLEGALEAAPPGTRAPLLEALATVQADHTGPQAAIPLFHAALEEAGGDTTVAAAAHFGLAAAYRFADDLTAAEPHAAAAVELAERAGDAALLSQALATSAQIGFSRGRGFDPDVITRAVELDRREAARTFGFEPRVTLGHLLFWSNRLEEARAVFTSLLTATDERDDVGTAAYATWYLTLVEWRAGDWERAGSYAERTLEVESLTGRLATRAISEWPGVVVAAHRGEVDDAVARSHAAVAQTAAEGVRVATATYRWVLGFVELSRGDAEAALPDLRAAHGLRAELGLLEPSQQIELPDLIDALVAVGELDEAEALLAGWEMRAHVLDRAWALAIAGRHHGLILAARGDLDDAIQRFGGALAEHARSEDPFQEARTRLALGATLRRAKQRGAARTAIGEALAAFERLGAPLWAERAHEELARIGGRTPTGDELTEAERRVVELVAAGHTNRETAAALFVTEHTVEAALTRAYRKLGVRSRTELAARLSAPG